MPIYIVTAENIGRVENGRALIKFEINALEDLIGWLMMLRQIRILGFKIIGQVHINDEKRISDLEHTYDIKFPLDYISLIKHLGYFQFVNSVMSKSIRKINSISIDDNLVPVGRFFTWQGNYTSIENSLRMYSEQLPAKFIPFAEGESGDLIGFDFIGKNAYSIGYWHHEGAIGNDVHVIAKNFKDFINSLIKHEVIPDSHKLAKIKHVGPSPKMIELLRKTGKWKGP